MDVAVALSLEQAAVPPGLDLRVAVPRELELQVQPGPALPALQQEQAVQKEPA